ncbi:protein dopey-1 [Plakobranchus ocellatus]|uniref:Protein dopey-1 n=1 Tax=Plakobranchus ocellatus TaxID=259542 RepID=A0AAV4DSD0_9GAST|nr:protein dopey-1 [Plakobranchus ocellatus]
MALKNKLQEEENPHMPPPDGVPVVIKPFRILISLLDKPEIGPVILDSVLLSVFRRLKHEGDVYQQQVGKGGLRATLPPESKLATEILKTANLLFGSFEPYFIWDFIARVFTQVCEKRLRAGADAADAKKEEVSLLELCSLVEFVLDIIALDVYPETTTEHLPDLLHQVISALSPVCDRLTELEVTTTLRLCSRLLARVQPSMASQGNSTLDRSHSVDTLGDNVSVFSNSELVSTEASLTKSTTEGRGKEANSGHSKETAEEGGKESGSRVKLSSFEADVNSTETRETKEDALSSSLYASRDEKTNKLHSGESSNKQSPSKTVAPSIANTTTSGTASNQKALSGHLSLMQLCVQSFQQFFHSFTQLHILQSSDFAQSCMAGLMGFGKPQSKVPPPFSSSSSFTSSSSSSSLSSSDRRSQKEENASSASDQKITQKDRSWGEGMPRSGFDPEEVQRAYKQACRLLVDFASFPVYCLDYETIIEQMCSKEESSSVPPWLQDLLVCCCYIDCFEIQAASISTVLDLIILTQSVQTESENKTRRDHSSQRSSLSEGRISVVILPALLPSHLVFINQRTRFYQVVAQELWAYLSELHTAHHQRTVELFHTLHQVTPSASVCEDVIGHDLICESEVVLVESSHPPHSSLYTHNFLQP